MRVINLDDTGIKLLNDKKNDDSTRFGHSFCRIYMGSSHVPVYAPMVVSCLSYHPGNISGGRHSGNPVDGKKQDTACEIIQQCFDTENNTLGHPIGGTAASHWGVPPAKSCIHYQFHGTFSGLQLSLYLVSSG